MEWKTILIVLGIAVYLALTVHFLLLVFSPVPPNTVKAERYYVTVPKSTPLPLPSLSEPASVGLSVIVPAFNEDERLPVMVDEAMEYLLAALPGGDPAAGSEKSGVITRERVERRREGGVEMIVVDDGSKDRTTSTAQRLAEKWAAEAQSRGLEDAGVEIRVVKLRKNRGKGGAVQHGVLHARGRSILFADADGATRFSDLDLLLDALDKVRDAEGHGVVVGSRAHLVKSEAVVKRSKLRNLLMHGFHLFLRTLGVSGIRDTQCGFKLFTRSSAQLLFPVLHLHRWSFDVELLLLSSLTQPPIPVVEVPVAWHEVSGSKISLGWDSLGMARDLLVLRGNLLVRRWQVPMRQTVEGNGAGGDPTAKAD